MRFISGLRLVPPSMLLALLGTACAPPTPPPEEGAPVISLVEKWPEVQVDEPTPPAADVARAEIRFDGTGLSDVEWSAVAGVADLRIEDGRLVGRTTSPAPAILLETAAPLGTGDELWSAKIELRASAGSRVGVHPVREPGPPIPAILDRAEEWPLTSPLVPGEEPRTYSVEVDRVFTLELPIAETEVRRILVRPTSVADADFAIESVRLVFRREHLASIPSGPGWHGLGEVFRETLVSRAPETLSFTMTLPEDPWLHLAVGSIEEPVPSFRVAVDSPGSGTATVSELGVEEAERWHESRLDLKNWSGRTVRIRLTAQAKRPGALAFWGAPTVRGTREIEDRPQTVIVFLADTLRSDHLDAWGYARDTAPTLTRLAAKGVRFDDAQAQATWTKVSVSSLLSSLYPSTTGIADLNDRLAAGETTLAEVFREAGYATFATSSVPFSGQLTNLHQGVEVLHEFRAGRNERGGEYRSKTAQYWVSTFLAWLELHRDVPVFAFLHAMDPHSPFRPQAPFDTMWTEPGSAERFAEQSAKVEPHIESPLLRRFMAPSRQELRAAGVDEESFVAHEKAWYDGSIRGMDAQLGRLTARLGELGLAEKTVLAFASDHGEEFLEHGRHWHGQSVYGEVANVPLVLWGRGVPSGRVVSETVQNIDLLPTLLDLVGLPIPERAQGRSLLPLMRGESDGRSYPAFVEHRGNPDDGEWDSFAILKDGWKLILNEGAPEGVGELELYDHGIDPLNLTNLASEHPGKAALLRKELVRWRSWAESQRLDPEAIEGELSAEELERLRSLGYIE